MSGECDKYDEHALDCICDIKKPRSWLSEYRDAWYQENLLKMRHLEFLDKKLENENE